MMLQKIKNSLIPLVGSTHLFRFNGSRNQIEEYKASIISLYPRVFTIQLENGITKSFSYNDLLTKQLEIIDI
ncbi:MAG: Veg family protein [Bacilli bacterium]|nr:Veg family protein [Bacilli bacterium]